MSAARRLARRACALAIGAASASLVTRARADDSDGAYGRLEGDLTICAGMGAAVNRAGPSLLAEFGARYLETTGLWIGLADALGGGGSTLERSIAAGIQLSPLFLGRFATNVEQGPATLDLALDSLALGVGAFWEAADDSGDPGLEVRLGVGLPLLGRASGPWIGIRGALRLNGAELGGRGSGATASGSWAGFVVAWQQVAGVHLVDAADRRRP